MELVARQFIQALRGKRSQAAMSRRLGYRANVVSDWEAGRRYPTAEEALRACEVVRIDVDGAFRRFHPIVADARAAGLGPWLEALRGSTTVSMIAERAGRSRFAVARWLAGRTRPRLPDWLRLVDALTGRLTDLLAELVNINKMPSIRAWHLARVASRRLASETPWTEAVLRAVETGRSTPLAISRILGLPVEECALYVSLLEQARVVKDGRVAGDLIVDTRAFPTLREHWAQVARDRLRAPHPGDVFSYNVISVSRADLARIETAHRAYFREVNQIVKDSTPPEVVALVNVQLMRFEEPLSEVRP